MKKREDPGIEVVPLVLFSAGISKMATSLTATLNFISSRIMRTTFRASSVSFFSPLQSYLQVNYTMKMLVVSRETNSHFH